MLEAVVAGMIVWLVTLAITWVVNKYGLWAILVCKKVWNTAALKVRCAKGALLVRLIKVTGRSKQR